MAAQYAVEHAFLEERGRERKEGYAERERERETLAQGRLIWKTCYTNSDKSCLNGPGTEDLGIGRWDPMKSFDP